MARGSGGIAQAAGAGAGGAARERGGAAGVLWTWCSMKCPSG
uniref:Uncharacterized protein n=1 Tax=Arundo donax TaxID=35708 RepID=A0A0A9BDE4_ARUDO